VVERDRHRPDPGKPEQGETHLFCHRCGRHLQPGKGDWYVVRVEAFADPTPPSLDGDDVAGVLDVDREIENLLEQMREMSERELMDQVYRRFTMHLCGGCYKRWLENPAG
jgi:hypothetical protein